MKKISIFAPVGSLDHQTGILNAIKCFASEGYFVDVLSVRNKHFPEVKFNSPNIRMRYMPYVFHSKREPRMAVTILFSAWVLLSFWRRHRLIFAGGIRGLFAAYFYSRIYRTSIINYQTELYIDGKLDTKWSKLFKRLEIAAARRSVISIEHDEQRKLLLCNDLGLDCSRVITVPNAPFGPGKKMVSDYLYKKLDVDTSCKLILNPGTIGDAFDTPRVVRISQDLNMDWRCIVHSAKGIKNNDSYVKRLVKINENKRVVFSFTPVPYSEIEKLFSSAKIGLVLYSRNVGENTSSVGLASGKLTHFLKLGIPVIVSDLPGLSDFVTKHRVGVVLREGQQLQEAVEMIFSDIDGFSERCIRCFNQVLAYEANFSKVLLTTNSVLSG